MSWSGPPPVGLPSWTNIFQPFTDHAMHLNYKYNLGKTDKRCLKLCAESQWDSSYLYQIFLMLSLLNQISQYPELKILSL